MVYCKNENIHSPIGVGVIEVNDEPINVEMKLRYPLYPTLDMLGACHESLTEDGLYFLTSNIPTDHPLFHDFAVAELMKHADDLSIDEFT